MSVSPELKKIETLVLEETHSAPRFDIGVRKFRNFNAGDGIDFKIAIYGTGFEASRNCNRDELIAVRDWIDGVPSCAMTRFIRETLPAFCLHDAAALVSLFLGGALFTTICAIIKHGAVQ